MGPYVLGHVFLIGLFAFAALHYFWQWWLSRREYPLLVFAAQCALSAVTTVYLIRIATATTPHAAQIAFRGRATTAVLAIATATWLVSRLTNLRARRFVTTVLALCGVLAAVNALVVPLNATVTEIIPLQTWWGETLSFAVRPRGPRWLGETAYVVAASSYVYGAVAAARTWRRDRLVSTLVMLASAASIVALVAAIVVDLLQLRLPYLGTPGLVTWVVVFAILLAREYARRGAAVASSISQQARTAERLSEQTSELNLAQHLAGIGSSLHDLRTDVVVWSDELYRLFGLDPATPPPSFAEFGLRFFTPDSWARLSPAKQALLESRQNLDLDLEIVRADGAHRWVRYRSELEDDASGQPAQSRTTVQDITDRTLAAQAARENADRFKLLVEGVADYAILMLDPAGHVTSWNLGAERIKGFREEEIVGQSFSRFYTEEDLAGAKPAAHLAVATAEGRCEAEGWRVRKGGARFWANVVITVLRDAEGRVHGFAYITRDMTERRRLEAQLQQSQKMESLGRLAGGVAHDFNNLLTIINGYGDVLLSQMPDNHPLKKPAAAIRSAGERAADLTRRLLLISRAQLVEAVPLDLDALLNDNRDMFQRLVGEGIELNLSLGAGGQILADGGQMHQVIMNLVANARDAMPQGGAIAIATAAIAPDDPLAADSIGIGPGPYIRLTVSDTGPGIAPEIQDRIFDPFFTTKGSNEGTGLGLSIVDSIVRQAGGAITVGSAPGHGALFTMYFPRVSGGAPAKSLNAPPAREPRGIETILVVEDQELVRDLVVETLTSAGYRVLQAARGDAAVELAANEVEPIHLLITDVVMPRMMGPQVAEQISRARPDVKVLYMSGYSPAVLTGQPLLAPDVAYLPKPFSPAALLVKVREILDTARAGSARLRG